MTKSFLSSAKLLSYCFATLLFAVTNYSALAQATITVPQAYAYLQTIRQQASAIVGDAEQPSIDSLQKAEKILQSALTYANRPEVVALTKEDASLSNERNNVLLNLAVIQVKSGQKAAATQSLLSILAGKHASLFADYINQQAVFEPMRQDTVLRGKLDKMITLKKVFNSAALKTPYRPNISEDEK